MFPHCTECKGIQTETTFKERKNVKTGPNLDSGVPTLYMHLAINAIPKVRHKNMCYDVQPTFPVTDLVIFKNSQM
jgi:hypothetical protein